MTDENTGSTWVPRHDESDSVQFGRVNLAANLNAQRLSWGGGSAASVLASFVPAHPGNVTWISGCLSTTALGGAVNIAVFKNGNAWIDPAILILENALSGYILLAVPPATSTHFEAGDYLDLRVTTPSGWTSTTAGLAATLGFSYAG